MAPMSTATMTTPGANSANVSSRNSPATGSSATQASSRPKRKVNTNGYHPANSQIPLSSMASIGLDLTSVERRGQPTAVRESLQKKSRPHGISEAPTYCPTEEEWRDPLEYMKKITPEASQYGICKIIPPDSWNPDFAIDTEKFHFRTRKQELNSVEGSTRASLTYLDGLSKFHKQQGSNLHRLPYVDKKPLDLYRLKKAVESRGGFDKVCKLKKWAEIGRDLGYSGKIMSSLSTSLKNSYQRWLCPYEEYLRLAKPGVHQQLEQEYGGPLTPSPAHTPAKKSHVNTPSSVKGDSPARQASDVLQGSLNGLKRETDRDTPMLDAPPPAPTSAATGGFKAINTNGFTPVNAASKSANSESRSFTPDLKRLGSPATSASNTPDARSGLNPAASVKRQVGDSNDTTKKDVDTDMEDGESSSRRSKRLKREPVPTVAGSHMTPFRPSIPRIPKDETMAAGERCENCGRGESNGALLVCESCDNAYHGPCLDPPVKRKPDAEWNCPRCLVGDGQFGFEEGGLYSLKQFQQKANDFKQGYFEKKMPFDHTLNCLRPVTEEDVETEFWRLVADLEETVEVEYGADIHCTTHGSGFPTLEKNPNNPYASDPWNLNILPLHPESLFRHIKSDISGMTVPWVYVGMIFSTFCWHNEDHYAYSANYQHFGATKTWYGIPGEDAEKFEAAMREAVPELFETQPDLLFQLVTLLTPEQLKKAGVRVYALDQRAGQFVITFPQAYHAGFNHGFNFNEAVNFAPSDWEPFGLAGVERLQLFRKQPCFSHDELLWTAADGNAATGLSIQTAKWLGPALDCIRKREQEQRAEFLAKHIEASPHKCPISGPGEEGCGCPLTFKIKERDVLEEEEQCCTYCKAFAFLSRFKCGRTGKTVCIMHAGHHPCCDLAEEQRFAGEDHALIYRVTDETMAETYEKVVDKARTPELWEEKYAKMLDEETSPSLKSLRALLHEGERVPFDLPSLLILKEFVDRCNDWVEEATNYIVRKQQNRRKNEKAWQSSMRKSIGSAYQDQKERESRNVSNIYRLLREAEHIGFECPEIGQLQERATAIKEFQLNAARTLENTATVSMETIEELLEEGRSFNVDTPEVDRLSRVLEQMRWNQKARSSRGLFLSLKDVTELIEDGKRLEVPSYNDHLKFYSDQKLAGETWEAKAKELIHAAIVHYPQLEALSNQVQANALPVSQETLAEVDRILHKQREAHRQIMDITERCRNTNFRKRPKYAEVVDIIRNVDELNSKPTGTIDLENERKRHEDWMRRGKKLFGKSNAPLHILKSHLEYVLERNMDCFDVDNDTPRQPAEPVSREVTPEQTGNRFDDRTRQVFCICRKVEAGMMIECELCHEWYHYKCLKIARGKVKEDDKYTCPICDWRMKIPRDAARPKLEDLINLTDEIPQLPFQPEEEDVLNRIIDNAQYFRDHIARLCHPLLSTEAEVETQRFFLRKLEGAEVLLSYETNFFRQELHKWCPVAPEAPPILEVSLSTRKPRPTKLQKMLAEYGVDNPDDLPEHAKGKANSLRRKAANAEAAAAAAQSPSGPLLPPSSSSAYGGPTFCIGSGGNADSGTSPREHPSHAGVSSSEKQTRTKPMDVDSGLQPGLLGPRGPVFTNNLALSLEDGLLRGLPEEEVDLESDIGKSRALEILGRTDRGRQDAEHIWGPDVWAPKRGSISKTRRSITPIDVDETSRRDEGSVDQMFKEMTNQEDDEDGKKKDDNNNTTETVTAESLESERNDLDAMIDGE
ncbi:Lysine-specific demethylase 5D [Metarhizium brunneum]|uniref:Lysine-specific demethylase 5D n=1 Tax=Metarhizium brunneum TaxID=500148 RepID=A0A7D5YYE2_9HYPO|nr:Lysine-specific demethylase 5D [Metarhizium brunneum]